MITPPPPQPSCHSRHDTMETRQLVAIAALIVTGLVCVVRIVLKHRRRLHKRFPRVVVLCGAMGAGKTTAADILCNGTNHMGIIDSWLMPRYREYAMAGPLKEMMKPMGFTDQQLYGTQADKAKPHKDWGVSMREFAQKFGTEVMRQTLPRTIPELRLGGRSIWVRIAEIVIGQWLTSDPDTFVVVSDGRYVDEIGMLREKFNAHVVCIERDAATAAAAQAGGNLHVSEKAWQDGSIKMDVRLPNNSTKQSLARNLFKALMKPNR